MNDTSQPARAPAGSFRLLRAPAGKLALLAVGLYVLLVATPLLPLPSRCSILLIAVASLAATLALTVLSVALLINGARLRLAFTQEIVLILISVSIWYGLARLGKLSYLNRLLVTPAATVIFLLACLWLGRVISRLFRERSILLPVCIAAAGVDILTVYAGPTGMMLQVNPEFVQSLSLAIPQVGSAVGEAGLAGLRVANFIGLGDFIFLAAFLSAAAKFKFNLARTTGLVLMMIGVGIATHWLIPGLVGLPLLPFIAAGFLLANWSDFQLTATEKRVMGTATLIIVGLMIVLWLVVRII